MQKISDNRIIELLNYPTESITFEDLEIAPDQFISGYIEVTKKTYRIPYDGNLMSGGYDEVEYDYKVFVEE
mgnify:CR=1 FL=1